MTDRKSELVPAEDDEAFDWVADAKSAVDLARFDSTAAVAASAALLKSLAERNDELTARLKSMRNIVDLQEENERLKLELAAVGPPEMEAEIQMYQKKLVTAESDLDVMRRQRDALANAVRSERIDRQRIEEREHRHAEFDPCMQTGPKLLPPIIFDAEATVEEQRNVARLTGRLDELDDALRRRGVDPEDYEPKDENDDDDN